MIQRITIENFKSLKKVDLGLGPLNLFIGANASGKSNFFDALRVLQGIGNGFTIGEILDGKPKGATSEVWEGIRGGSGKACFANGMEGGEVRMTVEGSLTGQVHHSDVELRNGRIVRTRNSSMWEYAIGFSPLLGRVTRERLSSRTWGSVYDSEPVRKQGATDPVIRVKHFAGGKGRQPHLSFERSRPVLTQFAKGNPGQRGRSQTEEVGKIARMLANTQHLDPSSLLLRDYSKALQIQRMGDHGENFAALIRTLCSDPQAKDAYLTWLRRLWPTEIDDVGTLSGAKGDTLFMLREGGKEFPAPVLSDGTLRFAAITAAFFQPDLPGIMTIEEIENGIHASRLRLLMELLRSRADAGTTQVMATTHSPIVLAWLKPEEYAHTFFCKRDEGTGESQIRPLSELPEFLQIIKRQPIGELFAEGWLEMAL